MIPWRRPAERLGGDLGLACRGFLAELSSPPRPPACPEPPPARPEPRPTRLGRSLGRSRLGRSRGRRRLGRRLGRRRPGRRLARRLGRRRPGRRLGRRLGRRRLGRSLGRRRPAADLAAAGSAGALAVAGSVGGFAVARGGTFADAAAETLAPFAGALLRAVRVPAGVRISRRNCPVWLSSAAAISSGVPVATTVPPPPPPSGPRSITQSAVLITSRLCSITMTVLPPSTSRPSTPSSLRMSSKCRPVVGSSST